MLMLLIGYVIRFQAVGRTVQAGLQRLPPNLMSASLVMGHGFGTSVRRVILPDAAVAACRTADRLCRYHEGITDDIVVAALQFRNAGDGDLSVCQGRNA